MTATATAETLWVNRAHAMDRMEALGYDVATVAKMIGQAESSVQSYLDCLGYAPADRTRKRLALALGTSQDKLFTTQDSKAQDEAKGDDIQAAGLTIPPSLARIPYPDETTIKQRLAGARERAGMSQTQAAKAVSAAGYHVTKKDVMEWEKGTQGSTMDSQLGAFAAAYGVGMKWLVTGSVADDVADADEDEFDDGAEDDDDAGNEGTLGGGVVVDEPDTADDGSCQHYDTTDVWIDLAGVIQIHNETDEATAKSRGWKFGIECNGCGISEAAGVCPVCKKTQTFTILNESPMCNACNASYDADLKDWTGGAHAYPCPHDRVVACVVLAERIPHGATAYAIDNPPPNVATKPARICLDCQVIDDVPLALPGAEHPQAGVLRLLYDDAAKHRDELAAKKRKAEDKVVSLHNDVSSAIRTVENLEALAGGLVPPVRLDAPRPKLPMVGSVVRDVEGQMDLLNDVPGVSLPGATLGANGGGATIDPSTCAHDKATEIGLDNDGDPIENPDWSDTSMARAVQCDACGEVWSDAGGWMDACDGDSPGTLTPAPEGELAGTIAKPSTPAVVNRTTGEAVEALVPTHRAVDPHAKTVVMPGDVASDTPPPNVKSKTTCELCGATGVDLVMESDFLTDAETTRCMDSEECANRQFGPATPPDAQNAPQDDPGVQTHGDGEVNAVAGTLPLPPGESEGEADAVQQTLPLTSAEAKRGRGRPRKTTAKPMGGA